MPDAEMTYVPYCGEPPVPQEIAASWNFDPILVAALLAASAAYRVAARREGISLGRQLAFGTAVVVAGAALLSPLCALGVALFGARAAQHVLLALVAAPLVIAARPGRALAALAGRPSGAGDGRPYTAAFAFAAAMWLWHAPPFYDATLRSHFAYWSMHGSIFASALALWWHLSSVTPSRALEATVLAAATSLQMGLLGALLTFAPAPLFAAHRLTTAPWGLTPLEDQQIGGLLIWIPGCAIFAAAALAGLARLLREAERAPAFGGAPTASGNALGSASPTAAFQRARNAATGVR